MSHPSLRAFPFCLAALLCVVPALIVSPRLLAEDVSWKRPLAEKEAAYEANILRRHNILGLYPSMVEIPPKGADVDITTRTALSDVVHAVCWTSNYLAGASYRYKFLKESGAAEETVRAAQQRADELFEAVYRCQRVTGVRGLQARGYFLGHGPVYAERQHAHKIDEWHQGQADGQALRWRGNPSHHNYSDAIHGLGQYYDLCAEGAQKERAREAIDALVSYWVDNDLTIHKLDRSRRGTPILGFTDGKTLNTRVMMAIAGAKVAHHATGKQKFRDTYDRLLEQFGVRGMTNFTAGKDFDDAEHVFCHLENLFRIETDAELLDAYGIVADALWANHKNDAHSLFTYIYYSIRPDAFGKEQALAEAHRSLQTWPTDTTLQPRMNSLFPDRKPPFPVYQARWDNEYLWKGDLLHPDGWLSRIVTTLDVSVEDSMVIAAADANGDLYLSTDGAASFDGWQPLDNQPGRVRQVAFGPRSRVLAAACDEGFFLSETGGNSWTKLPVPADGGRPVHLTFTDAEGKSLFAVSTQGVYRSRDFGGEFVGQSWVSLADELPQGATLQFHVAQGDPTRLYAKVDDRFFTRTLDDEPWTLGGEVGLGEFSKRLSFFAVDPTNPLRAFAGAATLPGRFPVRTIVQETASGGEEWSNGMETVFRMLSSGKLIEYLGGFPSGEVKAMAFHPRNPQVLFAIGERGVLKSSDGGRSWQPKEAGLDIPQAHSLMVPQQGDGIYVGTPGGLYVSRDEGETWENAHLLLQFTRNTRRELGGAAFIDAYWRARNYGFIDEALASRAAE